MRFLKLQENYFPPPKTVDFQSITEDKEQHEVCRLFLTSLMLSNSGTISLSNKIEGRLKKLSSPDNLYMKLLKNNLESPP